MAINASLTGRLRNTSLPKSNALLPLFEAVVNAIQAVDACHDSMDSASIDIRIVRDHQLTLLGHDESPASMQPIRSFIVSDNGEGFHKENWDSFRTLDSEYKAQLGCRGVGRLLWLKAFDKVEVISRYRGADIEIKERDFTFTATNGVSRHHEGDASASETGTEVRLLFFRENYRQSAPKHASTIARSILEHCIWYFVRPGGAPDISIIDDFECVDLNSVYDDYILRSLAAQTLVIKDYTFELTHLRLKPASRPAPQLNWCAANRVVDEENLSGKIPGLHGKLRDGETEFMYACFLSSPFLDRSVRSERTGFDIPESTEGTLLEGELSMSCIREAALAEIEQHLKSSLAEVKEASRARVEDFVNNNAPRYRPILSYIDEGDLTVDPGVSDRDLELQLHKCFTSLEIETIIEGQQVLDSEDLEGQEYNERLNEYLKKVDDFKKSDLAAYVFRRKVILELLERAIRANSEGKYVREDVIHSLIMPMRATSDDASTHNASNLWVIDERLAFHNYLASDKTLNSMPITGSTSTLEPDLIALKVQDRPALVSEGEHLPLASIVVVEIKRPMRNDATPRQHGDPLSQALRYLEQVRIGRVRTASGRPIPRSEEIPGFCYVIADLTATVEDCCKQASLRLTQDGQGYFGYNDNYKAYIEVSSFDRLLRMAHERNRAFFDHLGLPVA